MNIFVKVDRLKANGIKFSLTRRREGAKQRRGRVFFASSFSPRKPRKFTRPVNSKKDAKVYENRNFPFFAPSRLRVRLSFEIS